MTWSSPYLLADGQPDTGGLAASGYLLRAGESLTCHYQPQGRVPRIDSGQAFDGREPLPVLSSKYQPNLLPPYGNICIRWQPDLWTDLAEPDVSCERFAHAAVGLQAKTSTATIRYRLISPAVVCGRYEGLFVGGRRLDGLLVRVSASANPIMTIHTPSSGQAARIPLHQDGCEYFADLTPWADQHYEYELSFSLTDGQILRRVLVETWCHVPSTGMPAWCEAGRAVRLATDTATRRPDVRHEASPTPPLDLLLRWRHDGRLRTFRKRFVLTDAGEPFVPIPEPGLVQPLHMVLAACSRQ